MTERVIVEDKPQKSALMNVLSIVGFIIVVGIGIWGAINAARLAPSLFSGFSNPFASSTKLTLKLPTGAVMVDKPFSINWDHTPKGGIYAFSYACKEGVSFDTVATSTGEAQPLACNTALTIPVTTHALTIVPHSTKNKFIDVPLAVAYIGTDGKKAAENSGVVTVENDAVATSPTSTKGTGTTTGTTNTNTGTKGTPSSGTTTTVKPTATATSGTKTHNPSNPNGYTDLAVRVLSVNATPAPYNDPTAQIVQVRFEVKNVGTKVSPIWYFNANLPTQPPYFFNSQAQQALYPGDRIEYTLSFDHVMSGTIQINVDPSNAVYESTKVNNAVSYPIGAPAPQYSPQYNNYPQDPYYPQYYPQY